MRSFYTKKLKESALRIEEAERNGVRCDELLLRKNGRSAHSKKPVPNVSTLAVFESPA